MPRSGAHGFRGPVGRQELGKERASCDCCSMEQGQVLQMQGPVETEKHSEGRPARTWAVPWSAPNYSLVVCENHSLMAAFLLCLMAFVNKGVRILDLCSKNLPG